tara:strand:+ start:103 stop:360 length:258 start_codon:yes stop_codon:yes gene_type:complete
VKDQLAFHKKMREVAKIVAEEVYPYLMEGIKDRVNPPKETEVASYHSMVGYIAMYLKSLSYEKGIKENKQQTMNKRNLKHNKHVN